MDEGLREKILLASDIIKKSRYTIALTGAGVSVDSGIPDFRSPGGIWSRYDINEYAYIENFLLEPEKIWRFIKELIDSYSDAKPNDGHIAMARLEEVGFLKGIITQNIDYLHQSAGSKNVIEFHGNMRHLVCLHCRKKYSIEDTTIMSEMPPRCKCGSILKPDFVFFGEMIPQNALKESFRMASRCDVLLVAGTSAEVSPASNIPFEAKHNGAKIIELNLKPTLLTASLTDIFLQGAFAEVMPELVNMVIQ